MPMPTRSGLPISTPELGVDVIEREVDGARRPQRLPAAGLHAVALAEYGEQAVAQELVDPAAVRVDGGAGGREELVQDEDHVVGQAALRQLGEVAQVEKHHGQRLLDAGRVQLLQVGAFRPGAGRPQQARDRQRAGRPDLAGEAHVRRRGDAGERDGFRVAGRRERARTLVDAHAAGRAARAPAAHGGVRDLVHAADLEQRRPERHPHGRAAGVRDGHLGPRCSARSSARRCTGRRTAGRRQSRTGRSTGRARGSRHRRRSASASAPSPWRSVRAFSIEVATVRPETMKPPSAASGTAMAMNSSTGWAAR